MKTAVLQKNRDSVWDLGLDSISLLLMSIGVILAFDQLFRFHATPWELFWHPLLVILVLTLFARRMWILLLLIAAGLLLTASILSATGELFSVFAYIEGFFQWWVALFPRLSPYNTAANVAAVQWLIHMAIVCALYFCVRVIRSVYFMASNAFLLFLVIYAAGFRQNILAIGFVMAGLFPLLSRSYPSAAHFQWGVSLKPRRYRQAAALVVCAVICLCTGLLLPENTSSWKWKPLEKVAMDVQSLLHLRGNDSTEYAPLSLRSLGLQPYADSLGGNIALNNYTPVMRIRTDTPTLLKGHVYDLYTGHGWQASETEAYRLDSPLFSSQRKAAFDTDKVSAEVRETTADVTLLHRASTLYGFGRVRSLTLHDAGRQPVLFNARSELLVYAVLPEQTRYSFRSGILSPQNQNMLLLEQLAADTRDPTYESLRYQYTKLPPALPLSVGECAAAVTEAGSSPYQKMERLEQYLRRHFTYTLRPGNVPHNRDFIDFFLESKKGYCVYFASAMTVMARTLDIPARFVIGYGLEYKEGDSWLALQKNAHAWVECYFTGLGWITFDPTAGSAYRQPPTDPVFLLPGGVTQSSTPTVSSPAVTAATTVPPVMTETVTENQLTTAPDTPPSAHARPLFPMWGLLVLAAAVLWAIWRISSFQNAFVLARVQKRVPALTEQATYYYTDLLRQLAHLGYRPHVGETMQQFSARVLEKDDVPAILAAAFERMMLWRYGEIPPDTAQVEELDRTHAELELLLRREMKLPAYVWCRWICHR